MSATEIPITGYLDRFSHRPGETFVAHVGLRDPGPYRARLVRVISADPNPAGPGMRFEDMSHLFDLSLEGRRQEVRLGSYGLVEAGPRRDPNAPCTWTLLVQPGVLEPSAAVLAEDAGGSAIVLSVGPSGAEASIAWPNGSLKLATGVALKQRSWYRLWLAVDPASGRVVLGQQALDRGSPASIDARADGLVLPASGKLLFAAERAEMPHRHFTGKLEDPAILRGFFETWPEPLIEAGKLGADILAAWDFSQGIDGSAIVDIGPGQAPWPSRQSTDEGRGRREMERKRDVLAERAARLRRHPFSRRRSRRLPLAARLRLDGSAGHAKRCLCVAPDLARAARIGCRSTSCRAPRGRLRRSLSWLRPSPIRPMPIMRAAMPTTPITSASDNGAPIRIIRTSTRSMPARPITGIATIAASPSPRAAARS